MAETREKIAQNTQPLVTVALATCNRPERVKQAIQSILDQTFQDFELIVVDDGMRERADESVRSFADSRIRYIAHEEQRGCAGSRVTGIRAARGKYIAYSDDEDVWEPDKLALQIEALETAPADVGFSFTGATLVFDDRESRKEVYEGIDDYYEKALARFDGFLSVTLMFKREVFDTVGLPDPSFPSHTDVEFVLRVAQKYRGVGINKPLVRVNMKSDYEKMGTDFSNRIRGREMLLEKYREEFMRRPRILARHLSKLAWFYRSDGRYREARTVYGRALRNAFSWRRLADYLSMLGNGFGYRLFRIMKRVNPFTVAR